MEASSEENVIAAAALAMALPAAAFAHHGWSSYDASKVLTVTGKFKTMSLGQSAWHGDDGLEGQAVARGPCADRRGWRRAA